MKKIRQFTKAVQARTLGHFTCESCQQAVTQKELIIPMGPQKGETFIANYGCKCEDMSLARQVVYGRRRMERERLIQRFHLHSMLNESLKEATFDTFHPRTDASHMTKEQLLAYVAHFDPSQSSNLLLIGPPGVGKSHLSVAVTKKLLEAGFQSLFLSVPKLLTKIKQSYDKGTDFNEADILYLLESVDLFVLDDFGTEYAPKQSNARFDSWTDAKMFEILDRRAGKPTIYTTNLDLGALKERMTARNFSRMMDQVTIYYVAGEDYRQVGRGVD